VVLFHGGIETFSGGYVGVDVFFVISGYLITSIILREQSSGSFSLIKFYERRARRILPALFLVVFSCVPVAWWLFTPPDLKDFAQSLAAVATFSSNILFWTETGYWANASEFKPLLHTWSLAVEEQFYLFFPLLLMLLHRFSRKWLVPSCLALTLASLSLSIWSMPLYPSATFFLLPTRGWELGIGVLIACYSMSREQPIKLTHRFQETAAFTGLAMIIGAVILFDKSTLFPGINALIPTIGTGLLIIFATQETLVGKFLQQRWLVGIGLVSYSAYLWHQPLFAFARYESIETLSTAMAFGLGLGSFALAYTSWRFVEQPFRNRTKYSSRIIFKFSAAGTIALLVLGIGGHFSNGLHSMSADIDATELTARMRENRGLSEICEDKFTLADECRTADEPEILVWGDSYAMQIIPGILAAKPKAKIIQMTKSVCGPFSGLAPIIPPRYNEPWAKGCLEFSAQTLDWLKDQKTIRYVVVSSPFTHYLNIESSLLTKEFQVVNGSLDLAKQDFLNTLQILTDLNLTPVIFSPAPANGKELGRCLTRAVWFEGNLSECNFEEKQQTSERLRSYQFIDSLADDYRTIRLDRMMCNNGACQTHIDHTLLYRDAGHLSVEGSEMLGRLFDFYGLIIGQKAPP
jgi:peptidoglycan/LPS O-acetylase OafA/YrhL